jgi:hypothetical protein
MANKKRCKSSSEDVDGGPAKIAKTLRTHEENQERAYIAASRRTDRSIEARVESANRASEVHKKRTGRRFRITEDAVAREEMYEEEDDDLPRHALRPFSSDPSASFRAYRALQFQMVARAQFANLHNPTNNHGPVPVNGYYSGSLTPNVFPPNSDLSHGFMPPNFSQNPVQSNFSQHGYPLISPMDQNNAFSDAVAQNNSPQFATSPYAFTQQNFAQNTMYHSNFAQNTHSPLVSQSEFAPQGFTQSSLAQNPSAPFSSSQLGYSGTDSFENPPVSSDGVSHQERTIEPPRAQQTMAPPQGSVHSSHNNHQTHAGQVSRPQLGHGRSASTSTPQQLNYPANVSAEDAHRRISLPDHRLQHPQSGNIVSPHPISPHLSSPLQRLAISTTEPDQGQPQLTSSPAVAISTQETGLGPLTASLPPESIQFFYQAQISGGSLDPMLLGKGNKMPQSSYSYRANSPLKPTNLKTEDLGSQWTYTSGAEDQINAVSNEEHQTHARVTTAVDAQMNSNIRAHQETDATSPVQPNYNLFGSDNDFQSNNTGQQPDAGNFFLFDEQDPNGFDEWNLNSFFDLTAFDAQRPT